MIDQKQSYRHIIKAISLFGGVQAIQIFTNIIRLKVVAILLGPVGMGLASLFMVSINMIGNITGFGINFSAVRNISYAFKSNNEVLLGRSIQVFRRWMLFCGLLGCLVTLVFASYLSNYTFGNTKYTLAFMLLSCTLLLNATANGNTALLQGTHRIKEAAKASVVGSVIGLCFSIPLYFFYSTRAIVPSMILVALISYLSSWYYAKEVKFKYVSLSFRETFSEGKEMVKLGIIMMISVVIGILVNYLIDTFIRHNGGVSDVGLYQAGIGISNQYISLVFAAMAIDYFPRLSSVSDDNVKIKEMANQQAEIVLLIIAPLLIMLIIAAPLVIRLLLTPKFYVITDFVRVISLGMLFKAASYAVGYISFAKGNKKVYFFVEGIGSNLLTLIFSLVGYSYFGLIGLAISFLLSYGVYFVAILIITNVLYSFTLSFNCFKIFIILFALCGTTFFISIVYKFSFWPFLIEGLIFIISLIYSYFQINKRIELSNIFHFKIKNNNIGI